MLRRIYNFHNCNVKAYKLATKHIKGQEFDFGNFWAAMATNGRPHTFTGFNQNRTTQNNS